MLKKILILLFIILMSSSVFGGTITRNVPSTVQPGASFQVVYTATDTDAQWFAAWTDNVAGGCTPNLIEDFLTRTSGDSSTQTKTKTFTAPLLGSCAFSGDYQFTNEGVKAFPLKTVIISSSSYCGDGTCDSDEDCSSCPTDCGVCSTTCEGEVLSASISPTSTTVGNEITMTASIRYKGTCVFQGGLGLDNRYLDKYGNKQTGELQSTYTITNNFCDSTNPYYATVQKSSSTFVTDTFVFKVTPTKANIYDTIVSIHPECLQNPLDSIVEFNKVIVQNACTPETNTAFCSRLGYNCNTVTASDNCGTTRTVNCGSCQTGYVCTNNKCVQSNIPCEGEVQSLTVNPLSVDENQNIEITSNIRYKGNCVMQGGLGVGNRYVDKYGNPNCNDGSCYLQSTITVSSNFCDANNYYYATVAKSSNTFVTDTFKFYVKANKANEYDVISSIHPNCGENPLDSVVILDKVTVGGCDYSGDCDKGTGDCFRETDGFVCGVNKICEAGSCIDSGDDDCTPGDISTLNCPEGKSRVCSNDGTWSACEGDDDDDDDEEDICPNDNKIVDMFADLFTDGDCEEAKEYFSYAMLIFLGMIFFAIFKSFLGK